MAEGNSAPGIIRASDYATDAATGQGQYLSKGSLMLESSTEEDFLKAVYPLCEEESNSEILENSKIGLTESKRRNGVSLKRSSSWPNLNIQCSGLQVPKKEVDDFKKKLKNSLKALYNKEDEEFKQPKLFYIIANQLYRYNEPKLPFCGLCRHLKKGNCHIKSHIFPNSLLKDYIKIHWSHDSIVDLNTGRLKTASTLTYNMFCSNCEQKASLYEKKLKVFYLKIMAADKPLRFTTKQKECLEYVLALILFRGMLYSIDLWKLAHKDYFSSLMETFLKLQQFCETEEANEMIPDRMTICILPNACYNKASSNSFDLQLRNPMFTSVVTDPNSNDVFLYFKFDCFHCVLPVNDSTLFKNDSCFIASGEHNCFDLPHHTDIKAVLPLVLYNYNLEQASLTMDTVNQLSKNSKVIIHSDMNPIMPKMDGTSIQHIEEVELFPESMDEETISECLRLASKKSPLAKEEQQTSQIEIIEEENKTLKVNLEKKKEKITKLKLLNKTLKLRFASRKVSPGHRRRRPTGFFFAIKRTRIRKRNMKN